MEGIDRHHQIEGTVGVGQSHRTAFPQERFHFRHRVIQSVPRNIEASDFDARYGSREFVQQKSLTAADIEYPIASLEFIVLGHALRYGQPATIVSIAAIAGVAAS